MNKSFLLTFSLMIIFIFSSNTVLGQNPGINLNNLEPSSSPFNSPTPNPSTTPSPSPLTPSQPPRPPINICPALNAAYGATLDRGVFQESQEFGLIYPKFNFVNLNKEDLLTHLRRSSNFGIAKNKDTLLVVANDLNEIFQTVRIDQRGLDSISSAGNGIGSTAEENAAVNFYLSLYKTLEDSLNAQYLFTNVYSIFGVLKYYNLPDMPYLVVNSSFLEVIPDPINQPFGRKFGYPKDATSIYATYPLAPTLRVALAHLGCDDSTPEKVISGSPLIHIYGSQSEVTIKPEVEVTFASPGYSLVDGFKVKGEGRAYYEFVKDKNLESRFADAIARRARIKSLEGSRVVVNGKKLEDYLYNQLLPSLNLTEKELQDFFEVDIKPQLSSLSVCHSREGGNPLSREKTWIPDQVRDDSCNYEVILLQNEQVNELIPLDITPKPDTLIRNLIIIKETTLKPTNYQLQPKNSLRSVFTIVENGFILL